MSANPKGGVIVMKNKIPNILRGRNLNITDFHGLLVSGGKGTRISYPTAHKLATEESVDPKIEVQTLAKIAVTLGLTLNDLVEIEVA